MRIKKTIIATLAIMVAVATIMAGYAYYSVKGVTISLKETAYIYIHPEDSAESIINKIENTVHPTDMFGFKLLARHNDLDKQKRTGRYAIKDGDTMHTLYLRIVSNMQSPVMVTVPSTRTVDELATAVCKQLMMDSADLAPFLHERMFYGKLGYTDETLPTMFLPNTYEFYWDVKPERFMIRMMNERAKFWNKDRRAKAEAIGLSIEEVATLASIVDEETNDASEKPIVAGLYINRLKRGIPLQADPTVKFALGDFARKRILNEDLEVESPYNTYKNKGLPPGPIRIPSIQGIESVLNHAKHNYIYMCAKEDFSGSHNFATTLSRHNANAQRYRNALNKLNIKK